MYLLQLQQLENLSKLKNNYNFKKKGQAHITYSPTKKIGVDDLTPLETHKNLRNSCSWQRLCI